jgi:hypothetical protein
VSEHPEVLALAEVFETWHLLNSGWQPTVGESILCRNCDSSLFTDASGLRGLAPHTILHALCTRLEHATDEVAHELWLECQRCDVPGGSGCAHEVDARVRILDHVALAQRDLISATEVLLRQHRDWERQYAVRRLDEFLDDARSWVPSSSMFSSMECIACAINPLRGEAHVRRLPHDLRHVLYAVVDEIEEEFAENPMDGRCHWARALLRQLVVQSGVGMSAFVENFVDDARAEWIVDHQGITLEDVAREEAVAAVRPEWEALVQRGLQRILDYSTSVEFPRMLSRSGDVGRSPYAMAICPDLHWPAWVIDELVTMALNLRWNVCRKLSGAEAAGFDAWLSERLQALTLFEHRLAFSVQRAHGELTRRQSGLRLLAPLTDSIVNDL